MKFNGDKQEITRRAKAIRILLLDVDGILTDGNLYYSAQGEEIKVFNTLDGHGIKLLGRVGIKVGIVSGRDSAALARRADELGLDLIYKGREDKLTVVEEIMRNLDLDISAIAFAGDDLPDLAVISRAGLGITVPNAHREVKNAALLETEATGGAGAVREICDYLLQAQGHYAEIIEASRNGK
ncbi:MAG: HAD hydrolase family protein [Gammaproteobacteria bacterium]|nr:HAD hydrolase family protein [Gammaproteobacteria bacterium]